jgi:hypothetical protein
VKIDVQGAEEQVLRGAHSLLTHHRPAVFVELEPERLEAHGSSPEAVLALLRDHGYGLNALDAGDVAVRSESQLLAAIRAGGYVDVLAVPLGDT